jgi:hypothetical protein
MTNKTFGVCVGLFASSLLGMGAPASQARGRLAAGESAGASETVETTTTSSSAPAAPSPEEVRQRIDALKAELADLDTELASKKSQEPAAPVAELPQDQGSPAAATAAQAPAATPAAAPMPLSSPSMTAPLSTAVPHEFSAGPFGKLDVTGILSGMLWTEGDHIPGDAATHYDLTNGQIFVQKTTGWWQFYLQGGAYNIPVVGTPFLSTGNTTSSVYGPFPVGYLKLVKGNFNVEVGELPTLIGAEYSFTFENMNIERGLLWNQEPVISRGIQLNETYKKLTLAFSWNDGYFSNRYTSLSGSLAWAFNASNTLSFVASGNAGAYARIPANPAAFPTPLLQNNSEIYNLIYTYTHGSLLITPYYQYTTVPTNTSIGIPVGAHTNGGALLANYNFKHGFSLAVRPEYIKSSGSAAIGSANLLTYGSGTGAFSFTVTPTYSKDGFFIRGDFSIVHVTNFDPTTGFAFGTTGANVNQPRGVIEAGFLF